MKKQALLLLIASILTACAPRTSRIQEAIQRQMNNYPLSTMQDIYKSFYQDRFGAEHMIADTAAVRAYLLYELETAAADTVTNPYYEPVGLNGRYIRVYLRCVNEKMISADLLCDAFLRSAHPAEQPRYSWADEWAVIEKAALEAGIESSTEESELLQQAAQNNQAVHHSEAYRNAYHPHYRTVKRSIFDNEIKPFLYNKQ